MTRIVTILIVAVFGATSINAGPQTSPRPKPRPEINIPEPNINCEYPIGRRCVYEG